MLHSTTTIVEGDGLEATQKSLFYAVVHFHGH